MREIQAPVKYIRKYRECILAALCTLAACFSLLFAPIVNYSKAAGSTSSGVALSIVTWILMLVAAVLILRICSFASYRAKRDRYYSGRRYRRARIGLFTIAANKEGLAAELLLVAGMVLWGINSIGIIHLEGALMMLPYSLILSGLLLHCFFNGKSYIYIKRKAKKRIIVEKRGTDG